MEWWPLAHPSEEKRWSVTWVTWQGHVQSPWQNHLSSYTLSWFPSVSAPAQFPGHTSQRVLNPSDPGQEEATGCHKVKVLPLQWSLDLLGSISKSIHGPEQVSSKLYKKTRRILCPSQLDPRDLSYVTSRQCQSLSSHTFNLSWEQELRTDKASSISANATEWEKQLSAQPHFSCFFFHNDLYATCVFHILGFCHSYLWMSGFMLIDIWEMNHHPRFCELEYYLFQGQKSPPIPHPWRGHIVHIL